jgi:nucleoside-diphosphate-sugar epimerase
MDVLIAGGHGRIARHLIRILAADGHTARGLIRNPGHAADLEADGGIPVLCDLEREDPAEHVAGADAVVFAAGAGPGSGPERKRTVDLGGAVKCIEAAEARGVARFLMVSSIGAQDPDGGGDAMRPYLGAKAEADARLAASKLDWTVLRPGSLNDEPGTGLVDLSTALGRRGPVPREDVARVLAALLTTSAGIRATAELFAGDVPVEEAVRALESTPARERLPW